MPVEETRRMYLGSTKSGHIYVYPGKASAEFAKLLYDNAGIDFEVRRTNLLWNLQHFVYLSSIGANVFKNESDFDNVIESLTTIIEAYDIQVNRGFKVIDTSSCKLPQLNFDAELVLYNANEKLVYVLRKDAIPKYADIVFTCTDWNVIAEYNPVHWDQVTETGETVGDTIHKLFHCKSYRYKEICKKLCAFEDLYIGECI